MRVTVGDVRAMNNTAGRDVSGIWCLECVFCPDTPRFTLDLARYFSPLDGHVFLCTECDRALRLCDSQNSHDLPLAQRVAPYSVDESLRSIR